MNGGFARKIRTANKNRLNNALQQLEPLQKINACFQFSICANLLLKYAISTD